MTFPRLTHQGFRVGDHASALRAYHKSSLTPSGRPRSTGHKVGYALHSKADHYTRVWVDNDNAAHMRLHNTDVITYHPNGTVEIRPWPSMLTSQFVQMYGPSHVGMNAADGSTVFRAGQSCAWEDWMVVGGRVLLEPADQGWTCISSTQHFGYGEIDLKLARRVRVEYCIRQAKDLFLASSAHGKFSADRSGVQSDYLKAADLLRAGSIVEGLRHIPITTKGEPDFDGLCYRLYAIHGALTVRHARMLTAREYHTLRARNRVVAKNSGWAVSAKLGWVDMPHVPVATPAMSAA